MKQFFIQAVEVGAASGVVLGEQGQSSFTIVNEGALDVQFEVQPSANQVSLTMFDHLVQLKSDIFGYQPHDPYPCFACCLMIQAWGSHLAPFTLQRTFLLSCLLHYMPQTHL